MKHLVILTLTVALASSAPIFNETDDVLTITSEFFDKDLKIYSAEHEIIDLVLPLNELNFQDGNENSIIFFVEADIENGIDYKGLSVYKGGVATKILSTGTSIAADYGETKDMFFGATDGLYRYNSTKNIAIKYGHITDSIIDIVKENSTDIIYILTDKKELFNVTEHGEKKEKVSSVVGAKEIAIDFNNNLYYYDEHLKVYVVNDDGAKKIEGLPTNSSSIKLLNPTFIFEDGIPVVVDNKCYFVYSNGSSEFIDIKFDVKPSAYSIEAGLIQYHAYKKNIYEYNIMTLMVSELLNVLKEYLSEIENEIKDIATRSLI